jgi:hypothetical protein
MKEKWMRQRGKTRGKHFMDVALEAYIREVTLVKWRDLDDLMDAAGQTEAEALVEAGGFGERAPYAEIWEQAWGRMAAARGKAVQEPLMGAIEQTVREAMMAEKEARTQRNDLTIEDTRPYQAFIARAMGQLMAEASGETEVMDEELP